MSEASPNRAARRFAANRGALVGSLLVVLIVALATLAP
jgi:hypothetical protein